MESLIARIYKPKYFVKDEIKLGPMPTAKEGYGTAFAIAWAAIIETFLIALIGAADTAMVSVVGEEAIAAVGIVAQPRYLAQTLIFAINIAITSLCAMNRGANQRDDAVSCMKQGLVLSVAISIVTSVFFYPLSLLMIKLMGAQEDIIYLADDYFKILIIGLPFANISHTISSAQRGVGETKASMQINMIANIVNIVFNYLLINGIWFFPKLGVKGAAIATVIGWVCGFVAGMISISRRDSYLNIVYFGSWKFTRNILSAIKKISLGSFVEQASMRLGFITYAKIVLGLGTMMYAAHQILLNILSLSFSFGDSFGITASSLVGQNIGAKRPDLSIVYGKICQRMSLISSAVLFFVFTFCGQSLVKLFTDKAEIIDVSRTILIIMCFVIAAQASQMVFMGALRGAGDTKYTAVVSIISIMIVRPIVSYILAYTLGMGLIGAWFGITVDQFIRLILTHRRFSSGNWYKKGIKVVAPPVDDELESEENNIII